MSEVTEIFRILSEEHKIILKVVEYLEKKCDLYELGKEVDYGLVENAVNFIVNYADKFHHAKEEDILFKEFQKVADSGGIHCNPLDQMLHEHNVGRGYVKEIKEGLGKRDKIKVISGVRGYASLIREHIFKEDNILYPMADDALSPDIKESMLDKFKEIGIKNTGEKEKCLSFVENLK